MRPAASSLVSIVMTAWEPRPDWFRRAVTSILAEDGCELELVLVDDGSATPLENVLDADDPRLRIVRVEHGGMARARNIGVEAAAGDWLRFVDADDVFPKGGTALLLAAADGRNDVLAYGQTLRCDADLQPQALMECRTEGDAERECLCGGFPVRHMSMLFPRRVIERVGQWEPAFPACSDWDFVLRALEHAHVRPDPSIVTLYRNHPASMSADLSRTAAGMRLVLDRHVQRHPELTGTRLMRRARAATELKVAWGSLERGRRRTALRRLGRAALLDPQAAARDLLPRLPDLSRQAGGKMLRAMRPRRGTA